MLQIAYYSTNLLRGDSTSSMLDAIRGLLRQAERNNKRNGLTGYLLIDRSWFVQILEGEGAHVLETMARIEKDSRHTSIMMIGSRTIQARSFPIWSMGATIRTPANEEIFLEHGVGSVLNPRQLVFPTVLSLAMELQTSASLRGSSIATSGEKIPGR